MHRPIISSVGLLLRPDPAAAFTYPLHITRACIDALPARPGIYIFRDAAGTPLYIGKSVNIRSRVLSHLRTPDEARLLQRSTHIDFERTGGEIGALLLESALIKQWQPEFNKKLRRAREMCALRLDGAQPQVVYARDYDFAAADSTLYGLFASRRAALDALRELVGQHALCPVATGLETAVGARPCFSRQIGRCRGACTGHESAAEHRARLAAALEPWRVVGWPYPGPIGIVEESDGLRQVQIVYRWCYLGTVDKPSHGRKSRGKPMTPRFDIDTYFILVKPMLLGNLTIELL